MTNKWINEISEWWYENYWQTYRHCFGVSDSYSPAPAADVDDEGTFSGREDSKATSVEAVELADDEGKLEIDDRQEDDESEGDDDDDDDGGGVSQPVASTPQLESNKKDQLNTGESACFPLLDMELEYDRIFEFEWLSTS